MNTTYPMYADVARAEISQRLRRADDERRRRLARHHRDATRGGSSSRARGLRAR